MSPASFSKTAANFGVRSTLKSLSTRSALGHFYWLLDGNPVGEPADIVLLSGCAYWTAKLLRDGPVWGEPSWVSTNPTEFLRGMRDDDGDLLDRPETRCLVSELGMSSFDKWDIACFRVIPDFVEIRYRRLWSEGRASRIPKDAFREVLTSFVQWIALIEGEVGQK